MRKIKYLVSAALCTLLSLSSVHAYSDVNEDNPFAGFIDHCTDKGVVTGNVDGSFNPYGDITIAEFLVILNAYADVNIEQNTSGDHWAEPYLTSAISYRWVEDESFQYDRSVTRIEVAEALLNLMGAIPDPNAVNPFTDVDNISLNTLYDMGIISGSEEASSLVFNPESPISRAELCAIVYSMDNYFDNIYGKTDFRYLKSNACEPQAPEFSSDYFESLFLYMLRHNILEYELRLPEYTINDMRELDAMNFLEDCVQKIRGDYIEYGAFWDKLNRYVVEYTLEGEGEVLGVRWELQFGNTQLETDFLIECQNDFLLEIGYEAQRIFDEGRMIPEESDYNKAKYFFNYCNQNYSYDLEFEPMGYNGYGITTSGKGTCQAYVSAYNALCKMWGIESVGAYGSTNNERDSSHIWSYQKLDGVWYYTDPTWGDPVYEWLGTDLAFMADERYFAMTFEELAETHELRGNASFTYGIL